MLIRPGTMIGRGLVSAAAAAFTPASLSPTLWLDPSDLSTMYTDAGTTNVTTTGQSVYRINNKGSLGGYFENATGAAQPVYTTSGGLHWLAFDGTDDTMLGSAGLTWSAVLSQTAHGLIIGAEYSTINTSASDTTPYNNDAWLSDGASSNHSYGIGHSTGPKVGVGGRVNASSYYSLWTNHANGSPFVLTSSHVSGTHAARVNSGSDVTQAVATLHNSGQVMRLARNALATSFAAGKFFGAVAKNASLAANLDDLRTWMAAKAGVTL